MTLNVDQDAGDYARMPQNPRGRQEQGKGTRPDY